MTKAEENAELMEMVDGKWAITWSKEDGFSLITPKINEGGGREVPEMALALTACMIRLERDKEFRDECAEWFKSQSKS